jgi:hypothetical protein
MITEYTRPTSRIAKSVNLTAKGRTVGCDPAERAPSRPIVAEIRAAGVTSLHGIARALKTRGVPTATGRGTWEAPRVRRVFARLK